MIGVEFMGVVYLTTLLRCYDGDTCTIHLDDVPPFVATQTLRFDGFDTPEIKGKCASEKTLAREARDMTLAYMRNGGKLYTNGKRGKYGRLLVKAPALQNKLIASGLARPYAGGRRLLWC
ncbi:MAG: hypothetical protein HAW64_06175 [Alphaproteobacteria bacterium]|nr:hypothetical protein [Alphaproteobacteria bacterium]